ncbi:MAG TPA: hypothetical protein PLI22_06735 [Caldisericia bacterium]|nr:hypothetical protein [Caldisericia bacterium]
MEKIKKPLNHEEEFQPLILIYDSKKLKIYLDNTGNHKLKNWKRIIELNTGIIKE